MKTKKSKMTKTTLKKHKGKIIATTILILLLLFCVKNWNKWFKNIPEPNYTVSEKPEQLLLSIGETDQTRTLTWRCDTILQKAYVTLLTHNDTIIYEATGKIIETPGGKGAYYGCLIDSLKAGETYSYAVTTGTQNSLWYTFTLPEKTKETLSFIYFGDIQDSVNGKTGIIYKAVANRYPEAHFWLFGGDMIEKYLEYYWEEWFANMEEIAEQTPILSIPGNHEHYKGFPKKIDPRWPQHFRYPENGIDKTTRYGNVRTYGDVLLLSLTTFELPSPIVLWKQYNWAKKILQTSQQKWKIVTMHHPVYSIARSRFNPFSRWIWNPLFEKYKVDLLLQGHDHGYGRRNKKDGNNNITPLYIVTSCSPKSYVPSLDETFDRMASGVQLYQKIKIEKDTLFYTSYTADTHQLYDSVMIVKKDKQAEIISAIGNIPEILNEPSGLKNKKEEDRIKFETQVKKRQEIISNSK